MYIFFQCISEENNLSQSFLYEMINITRTHRLISRQRKGLKEKQKLNCTKLINYMLVIIIIEVIINDNNNNNLQIILPSKCSKPISHNSNITYLKPVYFAYLST